MKTLAALLLASTAFVAPAAFAQTTSPPATTTSPQQVDPNQPRDTTQDVPGTSDAQDEPVDVSVGGQSDLGAEIVVVGRNIPDTVRATPQVVSVLSTADIARTGEGDIAGALSRVTGLSLVGNGFVYVRGLGDRYSSSLLNGSPLPSPEPLRRVVPLDIFPTNVIASALVQKSYSANYPGEFGGGVINLTTRAIPEDKFLQVGGGITFDTVTTSELGYVYDGGKYDTIGYDSGERTVPGFIRQAGANSTSVNSVPDLISLSNAPTSVLESNFHIPPNWSGDLSFGGSVDVGSVRIGLIGAGGISNGWRTRAGIQQVTDSATGTLQRDFDTVVTDNRVIVNGLLGLGAEFGNHKVRWTNLYIHDTLKQGRLARGSNANIGVFPGGIEPLIEQNTNWFERQLINTQLAGEFKFGDVGIDLRGNYAKTDRNSPYERSFSYVYNEQVRDYTNNLSGQGGTGANVNFSELSEELWSGQADLSYRLPTARPITVSGGYFYADTVRDSFRYTFRYLPPGGSLSLPVSQQRPDFLLSDFNIQTYGITLQNTSTGQGAAEYDAGLQIHAGYGQVEAELIDAVRLTAGVRFESAEEFVNIGAVSRTQLNNSYWLPAATVTWNFTDDMQLRLHGSKTIARPQFRELAPQVYQDFDSDRQFLGNPLLVDSELLNAEARYEWFFARDQRLTLAGFYKKIDNPIETVAFFPAGAENFQVGFANAPSARLYGGEIEAQKYIRLDGLGPDFFATRRLVLIANYTYTKSEIQTGTDLVASPFQPLNANPILQPANLLFGDGAPLVGQSDHLVNLQLGIEDTESLSQATVLFTYASDRVTTRGPVAASGGVRLPDLTERPGIRLDVVLRQGVTLGGLDFELKLEGRNLTKTRYQEFQLFPTGTRVENNTYNLGRIFALSLSAKI